MNAVIVLIVVGVALIGGGLLYNLFDDILTDFFLPYVYNPSDPYYLGSQLMFDAIPYAIMIIGVILLFVGGKKYKADVGGGS